MRDRERSSEEGRFRVNGHDFTVVAPYLEAFVASDDDADDDEAQILVWQLAVKAQGGPPTIAGSEWTRPWTLLLASDPGRLLTTRPEELRRFLDLAGRCGGWEEWEDETGEPHASLCLFEAAPIYSCRWRLSTRGASLILNLEATTDLSVGEGWMHGLPLDVETPVTLAPIPLGRERSEDECRTLMRRFVVEDRFEYERVDGVAYLRWVG